MPRIRAANYNAAKTYLTQQGSLSAGKAHPIHRKEKDAPDFYGKALLAGAMADFANLPDQGAAILQTAAQLMGITWP